jgi:hypothetical protein
MWGEVISSIATRASQLSRGTLLFWSKRRSSRLPRTVWAGNSAATAQMYRFTNRVDARVREYITRGSHFC